MSRKELTLQVDQFNRNKVYDDILGKAITVTTLFAAKKGRFPCHPDMGFDIERYRFTEIEKSISSIKTDFMLHCRQWIPEIVIEDMEIFSSTSKSITIIVKLYNEKISDYDGFTMGVKDIGNGSLSVFLQQ